MVLRVLWRRPIAPAASSRRLPSSTVTQRTLTGLTTNLSTLPLHSPLQVYRSTSNDPYLNLSLEHHILQRSHPDSTVLFLYTNRPCVVIGRNQNPWLEVNLALLRKGLLTNVDASEPIYLVRRRSGGGTVFHDLGNANWSVICPPASFDRDKHALMVVRALTTLGVSNVRVNERHDIVQDQEAEGGAFKVSGSAYKLTRERSLHHGTCLLASENLTRISGLLRSPAENYIKAKGVESVRSPIRNVGLESQDRFATAVADEFKRMYDRENDMRVQPVGPEEAMLIPDVVNGVKELTDPDWIFGQTPQFTLSTHPTEDDPRERPGGPPPNFNIHLNIRHGEITAASVSGPVWRDTVNSPKQDVNELLVGQKVYRVKDWRDILDTLSSVSANANTAKAGEWLNHVFAAEGKT